MKKILAAALIAASIISFASCASSKSELFENAKTPLFNAVSEYGGGDADAETQENAASLEKSETIEEKLIKTVELSVQTKEYDDYIAAIEAKTAALNGYIEYSSTRTNDYGRGEARYSDYKIRIPSEKLDEFLASAGEKGKITSKSERLENATLEYADAESRINAYKTEKATLTKLLEKAESLEDVLAVQERLSDVNYKLDSCVSQLKTLQNRVVYGTVNMSVSEVERVAKNDRSIWGRIKERFFEAFDELKDIVQNAIVGFIGGLPIIIPAAALIAAAILIIRAIVKKRKKK